MKRVRQLKKMAVAVVAAAAGLVTLTTAGCVMGPPLSMQADRYRLEVRMDPATHRLVGRTVMDLVGTEDADVPAKGPASVEFLLHPDLKITQVAAGGATVKRHVPRPLESSQDEDFAPRKHLVVLDKPVESLTLFVDYEGELFQDIAAGEIRGQIHNFAMRAHIGEDGIYLSEGNWYPEPVTAEDAPPGLAEFTIIAEPVDGFELVAGAERDPALSEHTGRIAWRTPYPLADMVLVGGPHEVHRDRHGDVAIEVHLLESQARHAPGLIEAVKRNLDRYEPLVGPYPANEYAIVDNFFSSGFAFPTFTLLSSAVINMGKRSQTRHGFLDHEMLHCWWGNGIHVDPRDGNWCEAVTSYATNYYGYVLDGDQAGARRKRRNNSHFLSRMKPEDDKPLGTFDREDGCGRGIGYSKGTMVVHMLARRIGQDTFWAAMRRFTDEYLGKYAGWEDIRRLCEQESGASLATFFEQWVRGSGAPVIRIAQARYDADEQALTIRLSQGEPPFDLKVPIRITHADGEEEIKVPLATASEEITIPVDVVPLTVEADRDYHIFRKIPLGEIVPTTAATRYGDRLVTVLPQGEVPEPYQQLRSIFESSFEGEGEECRALTVGLIEDGALAESCVLILGEAVRDSYIAAFLSAIEFPVRWFDGGFELAEQTYTDPGDAVLATAAHPGVPGGGVTVVFANSPEAFPNPRHISFYSHSVVVFQNGRPTVRRDLEHRNIVPVEPL